ncbi:MAG: enoyl-CoA hydratase/isomerase family protein [Deltaproteobacteria bacterium]|nr:enoyl-CoA hydratase/isomerase family protein [Deltaproteobacteria bacterium]
MSDPIRVEHNSDVVVVTLDAPRGNALSHAMVKDLSRALYKAEQLAGPVDDPKAWAIVITGKPGVFCGGLDLKEGHGLDRSQLADWVDDFEGMFLQLFSLRLPVVAAVNGPAIAGGAILALACDERVGPLEGKFEFGLNEVVLGLPFPSGALEIAKFSVRSDQHVDVLMKGRRFGRAEALDRGLIDELAADVLGAALDRARVYQTLGARAVQKTKTDLRHDALARARARAIESRRFFVESWTDPLNVARRQAVLDTLSKKA